ncbi:MAG: hypothetical protein AAB951_00165, partial [Patescibacteria group bacterium]
LGKSLAGLRFVHQSQSSWTKREHSPYDDNPDSIAGQMKRILNNPDEITEILAKQKPNLAGFNWQNFANRMLKLFTEGSFFYADYVIF